MSCRTAAAPGGERQGADWGRFADGIGMVGFAVFLLMNTTGFLPWSFWLDAISLWPLLVMSAGVKIAFEKSRAPWLVLIGPAIVLGGLAWLASGARPEGPVGPWQPEAAAMPEGGATGVELEVKLVGARLRVTSASELPPGHLVDGRSMGRHESARLEVDKDGDRARVLLRGGERHGVVFLPRPKERWELELPPALPVGVRLSGAGIGARFELTRGPFLGLRSNGAFVGVEARLPAPAKDIEIRMEGAFNSLTLIVPEGTPVRVHGAGLPFNAVNRGVAGKAGRPGYDVRVGGVFSAVDVRTDPAISPEPPAEAVPPPGERPLPEAPPGGAGKVS
jgi:hypothetical protein